MSSIFERLFGTSRNLPGRTLDGFVDSLLQSFENRRPGLSDERARQAGHALEEYFLELYEDEAPRLRETITQRELALSDAVRQELYAKVDDLIRKVVIPAYARIAGPFTLRERNDFYLTPAPLHGPERLAFAVAGIVLGSFVIWAPFIPLWSKEWVLPFAVAGLMFPNIRRWLALRRYQAELNHVVARADDEVWRMELAYVTGEGLATRHRRAAEDDPEGAQIEERLRAAAPGGPAARRRKLEEGER